MTAYHRVNQFDDVVEISGVVNPTRRLNTRPLHRTTALHQKTLSINTALRMARSSADHVSKANYVETIFNKIRDVLRGERQFKIETISQRQPGKALVHHVEATCTP